ncbi:hypothetical protein B0T21DRAFT_58934 [Apiosordaria backusii]|uniref:NADH-ubiquinone oxidoreductase 17.8 kDa subunit n=1 Tax=Apiosordaria backusii TaxID=314023 RepID=A0AA40AN75_9PEZI|nr:hypothetical protein B0T21DRAFT_58934 [Apiosordaria backusii]
MLAIRQRAALFARQARPQAVRNTRRYGSSHGHDHHHEHTVEEKLGTGFYLTAAILAGTWVVYKVSRPGKDGELSTFSKWLKEWADLHQTWETRNDLLAAAVEQAAQDKHLMLNAPRNRTHELRFPEVFNTGSPFNVPAGHYVNIDKVVAHYQQQHLKEEERKAAKLAAAAQQ